MRGFFVSWGWSLQSGNGQSFPHLVQCVPQPCGFAIRPALVAKVEHSLVNGHIALSQLDNSATNPLLTNNRHQKRRHVITRDLTIRNRQSSSDSARPRAINQRPRPNDHPIQVRRSQINVGVLLHLHVILETFRGIRAAPSLGEGGYQDKTLHARQTGGASRSTTGFRSSIAMQPTS